MVLPSYSLSHLKSHDVQAKPPLSGNTFPIFERGERKMQGPVSFVYVLQWKDRRADPRKSVVEEYTSQGSDPEPPPWLYQEHIMPEQPGASMMEQLEFLTMED